MFVFVATQVTYVCTLNGCLSYSPPPLKKQRRRGYKEDPFIFLTSDVDIWPKIKYVPYMFWRKHVYMYVQYYHRVLDELVVK